jgi:poly(3-hydroxybutyrate) depolymerase
MRGSTWTALLAMLLGAAAGCGDDSAGNDADTGADTPDVVDTEPDVAADADADVADTEPETAADADADVTGLACEAVVEGINEGFLVDGEPRTFYLDLPASVETGGPWPVLFNYHGLGDTAANMRRLLSGAVDDPVMPFILVTPEDTNFALAGVMNIDWDVATVTTDNREARMFDEVLACLESRWGVDEDHVHAVGFSMGGFVVDALGTVRGEQLASIVSYSGAYGNDALNVTGFLASLVSWPDLTTSNSYVQVLLHGGTADTYDMTVQVLHFDQFAANDAAFLNDHGHDVILCNHGGGHHVPGDFASDELLRFFADHPRGTVDSPYASGLPATFPGYCTFLGAAK